MINAPVVLRHPDFVSTPAQEYICSCPAAQKSHAVNINCYL
jgi:hypothetical protein